MSTPVLKVSEMSVIANSRGREVTLVDRLSFDLQQGEILGLVGESGSGKTMACRALMQLMPSPDLHVRGGSVLLNDVDLLKLDAAGMRAMRGRRIGMIFQNPSSHLDPLMRIGEQIAEGFRLHQGASKREARAQAIDLLRQVGIPDPASRVDNFPHEFSGGMRQRAMIAVALGCGPQVLIADEPTTALDVTIQAQIMELLLSLQKEQDMALVLITHDLAVVAETAQRVCVMYAGQAVEVGQVPGLFEVPAHPYSEALLAAIPEHSMGAERLATLPGMVPGRYDRPQGCLLSPRCPYVRDNCRTERPGLDPKAHSLARCFYPLNQEVA
ncbi:MULTISPECIES: ABC transporter ATP-binding protein [Pseudomonas syringae group]|uniref:ABC-type dipeptide transporter n=5 Tax=Pseudomonas syringae group TaxID=136849 RepID=A0AB74BAI6_PSESS|nr:MULTISPECIES: ABC transporter ATP-binding protein [Pseudomonas syringae group]KPX14842.1 Oligopeptide transport ATP-binding protein [Pseudomonas syringae pv. daphniphylli]RMT68779.1 Oligopeptide transport ATP-binding protein [Pseudomonas savastanoi pv. nerii]